MKTQSHRPSNIKTFGQALKKIRTERGFSHKDVADRVGIKKDMVRQWEDDKATPSNFNLKKLYGTFSNLRFFTTLLPSFDRERLINKAAEIIAAARAGEVRTLDDVWLPPIAQTSEELPDELFQAPKPKTFGGHLRAVRLSEGLDLDDVGELMSVTGQAVGAWELDRVNPVKEHYIRLLELFPILRSAPAPQSADMPKPNGGKGISRNVGNTHGAGRSGPLSFGHSTLRAVPTAFDAIDSLVLPTAHDQLALPARQEPKKIEEEEDESEVEEAEAEEQPDPKLTPLEEAGADYARYLAARQKEELRVAMLKAELALAEKSRDEAAELSKIAHEKIIEIATKQ